MRILIWPDNAVICVLIRFVAKMEFINWHFVPNSRRRPSGDNESRKLHYGGSGRKRRGNNRRKHLGDWRREEERRRKDVNERS